jgi:histone acetyltransferase (RNA polymerase elongator complex component)
MISSSPFIIPIFLAHQGCPHQCVFCNQHVITRDSGQRSHVGVWEVEKEIDTCLAWPRDRKRQVQVAFYGGSFTGLNHSQQKELLGAVQPYLEAGLIHSIRLSTRPDYIDRNTAGFLKKYNVSLVELGVQSMHRKVLAMSNRGHSRDHVEKAFHFLKGAGLEVGGQLMIGLPGETTAGVLDGARQLAALRPDMVRIYPTLVIHGSPLSKMFERGEYQPMSLNKAVALSVRLKGYFDREGISVIRMGLQPSASLEKDVIAGPYHPAFGELVMSRMFFHRMRDVLRTRQNTRNGSSITITLAASDRSQFQGMKKCNLKRLESLHLLDGVEIVYSAEQERGTIGVQVGA